MTYDVEVVVVGAGVAGSAAATALARGGISVLVLEKSLVHLDRSIGMWMPPWGAGEAEKIGVLDDLVAAGAHRTTRHIVYGEGIAPDQAKARALDMCALLPGSGGAVSMGHPQICNALNNSAQSSGAMLLRGVGDLMVEPGSTPKVSFIHNGEHHEAKPRLVIGADGRGSRVARQIGIRVETDPTHHLMGGLLVEGIEDWPRPETTFGNDGDIRFYVFPQNGTQTRLFLCYGLDQRDRFAGPNKVEKFMSAFNVSSLPLTEAIASAQPAGPLHSYPNADTYVKVPTAPGVVLVGDAAGLNDPTLGQGLTIALRDARLVTEACLHNKDWTEEIFHPYIEERRERMRRLRFASGIVATIYCEFDEAARLRRKQLMKRMAGDPTIGLPLLAGFKGPFNLPDHAFSEEARTRLLS